jgi:hypothetical protein
MNRFEYDITMHNADEFHQVVFFCSDDGTCAVDEVPEVQPLSLTKLLNERGADGWELVQLSFGKDGVMAFWKRRLRGQDS